MFQFSFFWRIPLLKSGRQSMTSRVIAISDLTSGSLTLKLKLHEQVFTRDRNAVFRNYCGCLRAEELQPGYTVR